MIIWIAPVLLWLSGKAQDYIDFLRSIPSLLAPKPIPLAPSYTPPFLGGQCVGVFYRVSWIVEVNFGSGWQQRDASKNDIEGAIASISLKQPNSTNTSISATILYKNGTLGVTPYFGDFGNITDAIRTVSLSVTRMDNGQDTCGNVGNPSQPPSIADDGLFNPSNPLIADDNGIINPAAIVLAPAFPLALVAAILAGYQAAMQAAQAALAALEAIKKIAEGLESLKDLWEKLRAFLNEWEKNRPKKRDTIRQTYGQLKGDGALDFFPSDNQRYQSIQLDIVITTIPIGFGKFFGSFSPHRYRYKELGYIAFYSTTQGILEVHSIQFKRTSLQIPRLAVGFIYHLGLNEQIRGFAFGTFSVEKS